MSLEEEVDQDVFSIGSSSEDSSQKSSDKTTSSSSRSLKDSQRGAFSISSFNQSVLTMETKKSIERVVPDPISKFENILNAKADGFESELWKNRGRKVLGFNIGSVILKFRRRKERDYITRFYQHHLLEFICLNIVSFIVLIIDFFLEPPFLSHVILKGTSYLILFFVIFPIPILVWVLFCCCKGRVLRRCRYLMNGLLFSYYVLLGIYITVVSHLGWSVDRLNIKNCIYFSLFLIFRVGAVEFSVMIVFWFLLKLTFTLIFNIFIYEVPAQIVGADFLFFILISLFILTITYFTERKDRANYLFHERVNKEAKRMYDWKNRNNQLILNILPPLYHKEFHRFLLKRSSLIHTYDEVCFISINIILPRNTKIEELADIINQYFMEIDSSAQTYGIHQLNSPQGLAFHAFHRSARDCCNMAMECIESTQGLVNAHNWEEQVSLRIGIAKSSCVVACIGKKKVYCNGFGQAPWEAQLLSKYAKNGEILIDGVVSEVARQHFLISQPISLNKRCANVARRAEIERERSRSRSIGRDHSLGRGDSDMSSADERERERITPRSRTTSSLSSISNEPIIPLTPMSSELDFSIFSLQKKEEIFAFRIEERAQGSGRQLNRVFSNLTDVFGKGGKGKKGGGATEDQIYETEPDVFRGISDSNVIVKGYGSRKGSSFNITLPQRCMVMCKGFFKYTCMPCSPKMVLLFEGKKFSCQWNAMMMAWILFTSGLAFSCLVFSFCSFDGFETYSDLFPNFLSVWIVLLFLCTCCVIFSAGLFCSLFCYDKTMDCSKKICVWCSCCFRNQIGYPLNMMKKIQRFCCRNPLCLGCRCILHFVFEVFNVLLLLLILFSFYDTSYVGFVYWLEVVWIAPFYSFGFSSIFYSPVLVFFWIFFLHLVNTVVVEVVFGRGEYGEALAVLPLLALVFYEGLRYHFLVYVSYTCQRILSLAMEETKKEIEIHYDLLENMYPKRIALGLKPGESKEIVEKFHYGTLLQIKLVGFRNLFKAMEEKQAVVAFLNELFEMFDDEIEEFVNIEKIKSFGEDYYCYSNDSARIEDFSKYNTFYRQQSSLRGLSFRFNSSNNSSQYNFNRSVEQMRRKKRKKELKKLAKKKKKMEKKLEKKKSTKIKKKRRESAYSVSSISSVGKKGGKVHPSRESFSGGGTASTTSTGSGGSFEAAIAGVHETFLYSKRLMEMASKLLVRKRAVFQRKYLRERKRARRKKKKGSSGGNFFFRKKNKIAPLPNTTRIGSTKEQDSESETSSSSSSSGIKEGEGEGSGSEDKYLADNADASSEVESSNEILDDEEQSMEEVGEEESEEVRDRLGFEKVWSSLFLKIGIHSSNFVCATVGAKKRIYDIISQETRFILAMLCKKCDSGKINMSPEAFRCLMKKVNVLASREKRTDIEGFEIRMIQVDPFKRADQRFTSFSSVSTVLSDEME